ncbi:MarR family winged helix-turn-helix transcriptional regulator [Microbaculum marinum]|uniref:MarR family winged helix-turn-helix transcriptional regulator n=1 Tax=Microbaculum marinum TaxID=1764581 RepID=A0AAW9RHM5_9HYPH
MTDKHDPDKRDAEIPEGARRGDGRVAALADLSCTGYRLRKAARRVTALYDTALAPAGLTVTQFSILAMIATGGPRPMSGLADAMGMDASTLTRTLKRLIDGGDVEIVAGSDRRTKLVALTDRGQETVAAAVPYWRAAQKRVERAMGGEIATLHQLLRKVSAAADPEEFRAAADAPAGQG